MSTTSVTAPSPFMPVFAPPARTFVRGSGTELWDDDGNRYLDFLCGLAVTSLGHSNPAVAAAISAQASTLLHVSNFFANPPAIAAATSVNELLADATGYPGRTFFTNSGAEAVECAIKLARKFGGRGRHTVVSALGSFHGRTLAALGGNGAAGQARTVPTDARGLPPRRVRRRRRAPGRRRRVGGCRAHRTDPGRGRGSTDAARVPRRDPEALRRGRRADDGRRDPDRDGPHGSLVRVRARRRQARRRDAGQGARQRDARRRLLGPRGHRHGVRAR